MRATSSSVLLALLLLLLIGGGTAFADPRLGEPWEDPIEVGIARQRQEADRGVSPAAILRQAELQASRRTEAAQRVARLYLLARAYAQAGDRPSAIRTYQELIQLAPTCYFGYRDLAILSLEQDPPGRQIAEQYLRRAIQVHARYETAYRNLAQLLLDQQRFAEAEPVLRRLIELSPGDLQGRMLLVRVIFARVAQTTDPAVRRPLLDQAEREIVLLIRKEPKSPAFQELKGDLYLARGRYADARNVYKRLATEFPAAEQPLRKLLGALAQWREADGTAEKDEWLWALEGLYRLSRDPEERAKLKEAIEGFRRPEGGESPAALPEGPPTDETIISALERLPPEGRVAILQHVYGREDAPSEALTKAIMPRLSPKVEPAGNVRQWVLRVLARFGSARMSGPVRLSLGDPDADVRPVAADALFALAATGKEAHAVALLTLGLYVEHDADARLAGAARALVLELALASLPGTDDDAYGARLEAWRTWWQSADANEAKIAALEHFAAAGDMYPEDILVPYLKSSDPYVVEAAWSAMAAAAKPLLGQGTAASPARRAWFGALPPYQKGALAGAEGAAARQRLDAWLARKPAS